MVSPRPTDYRRHSKNLKTARAQALSATKKCANRMVERGARIHPPSVYNVGETVLIRYPGTGSKPGKKRYVLEAQVLKRNVKKNLYKVAFTSPTSIKRMTRWISVTDITSTTMEKERKRKKKAKNAGMKSDRASHRKKYEITYNSERHFMEDRLSSARYLRV